MNDVVAFDAGSLAMACSDLHRNSLRDVVVSHAHLDHIAGLPLFMDDLFSILKEPVRIHASKSVIDVLETHIFNWTVYPRFSELTNDYGPISEYVEFEPGCEMNVRGLSVTPIEVNHKVPSCGFIISDGKTTIATTGDTAPTDEFWRRVNALESVDAVLVECAFPDSLAELAGISHHLTPRGLAGELEKLRHECPVFVINIKPVYRNETVEQLRNLRLANLDILEVGREYEW